MPGGVNGDALPSGWAEVPFDQLLGPLKDKRILHHGSESPVRSGTIALG